MILASSADQSTLSPAALGGAADGRDRRARDRLTARQAELLYRSSLPQFSNLINAAIVAAVMWHIYPQPPLLGWLGLVAVVVAFRFAVWRRYRSAAENARRRVWLFTAGSSASGLLWGATASVLFLTDSLLHQFFVTFVTAGMGAGAVASNSAFRPALFAFLLPATAPLAVAFLVQGGPVFTAMGLMTLLFIGLLSLIGIHFNRSLVSGFRLQAVNEHLIERLSRSRHLLEEKIEERTTELRRANASLERQIAERRSVERALRLSEDRLLQATQLARLGYWVWDSITDRCLYCSEEHARIHGVDVQEYMARCSTLDGDFSLTHPDDREGYKQAIGRLRREGTGFEMEYRVVTPEGEVRHVREIVKPLFGESGKVVREFGTIQDVTDLKLAEEQLRQALKMQAVGQLAGGMAHDFNNLLGVIMANLELVSLAEDDPRKPLVDRSIRAVERGADLTRRLLTFTRQRPLDPRVLDLNAVLRDMNDLLSRTLGEGIELSVSLDPDLWPAKLDPAEFESALINLALNARDAMPDGGELFIETANAPADAPLPGDHAMVVVRDTGTGIERRHLDKVFEPFFTTKDVGQGNGLGLSMVYGFVDRSGGRVDLESAPGQGTTVRLYFPRSPDPAQASPDDHLAGGSLPVGAGESILLVEDDEDLRAATKTLLQDLGYRVRSAATGEAALDILRRDRGVAILFTDIVLPKGMNGRQLARRARGSRPDLGILFASGHTRETDGSPSASPLGPLIAKPYRKAELALALRQIVGARPGPAPEGNSGPGPGSVE